MSTVRVSMPAPFSTGATWATCNFFRLVVFLPVALPGPGFLDKEPETPFHIAASIADGLQGPVMFVAAGGVKESRLEDGVGLGLIGLAEAGGQRG